MIGTAAPTLIATPFSSYKSYVYGATPPDTINPTKPLDWPQFGFVVILLLDKLGEPIFSISFWLLSAHTLVASVTWTLYCPTGKLVIQ